MLEPTLQFSANKATVVKYTSGFHPGHLQTLDSAGSAPRSCESSPSAHLSEDGKQKSSEAWSLAKPTALTKNKQLSWGPYERLFFNILVSKEKSATMCAEELDKYKLE